MQIRRIRDHDGGNHLISDYLEYRLGPADQWRKVETMTSFDAAIEDYVDGIAPRPQPFSGHSPTATVEYIAMVDEAVDRITQKRAGAPPTKEPPR